MVLALIIPSIILGTITLLASIAAYIYRRRRKMESDLDDSETASIDQVEGVLGRINTQKTVISTISGSTVNVSNNGNYTKLSGFSRSPTVNSVRSDRSTESAHSREIHRGTDNRKIELPDGILNAHGKESRRDSGDNGNSHKSNFMGRFSSEFFITIGKKNKTSSSEHLQRHDSGIGGHHSGDSDQNSDGTPSNSPKHKKSIQNVYPSRAYKIARVNSLAPSVSGSIQNGLDQYNSTNSVYHLSTNKKSRRKNKTLTNHHNSNHGHSSPGTATCNSSVVGSVIGESSSNGGGSSNNSVNGHVPIKNNGKTHTNHTNAGSLIVGNNSSIHPSLNAQNGRIIHGSQNLGQKSPQTDQTDAASHVSETMSGVSNSNNSIKSLPEFIPNYENLNVRVETNRASLKLTNYSLPPLGTPSQSKHTMSRIISCESDYSSGCSSMGSYHKVVV